MQVHLWKLLRRLLLSYFADQQLCLVMGEHMRLVHNDTAVVPMRLATLKIDKKLAENRPRLLGDGAIGRQTPRPISLNRGSKD